MAKRALITVLVALVVLGGAVVLAHGDGDPTHGAALYAENCLACHGPDGQGRGTHEAFSAAIQYDSGFEAVVARGVAGSRYMFAWGQEYGGPLSAEDILDLRAYVQTWQEGAPEPLPVAEESTEPGAALYAANCAACHGPQGQGRSLAGFPAIGQYADVLAVARRGMPNSAMPPFAEAYGGPLSEADLSAIAAYSRSWERPAPMIVAAENSPQGAGMLILLIGLGSIGIVGLWALTAKPSD